MERITQLLLECVELEDPTLQSIKLRPSFWLTPFSFLNHFICSALYISCTVFFWTEIKCTGSAVGIFGTVQVLSNITSRGCCCTVAYNMQILSPPLYYPAIFKGIYLFKQREIWCKELCFLWRLFVNSTLDNKRQQNDKKGEILDWFEMI